MRIDKLTGRYVEIIYMAADGRLSQRVVRVLDVQVHGEYETALDPRSVASGVCVYEVRAAGARV